jgi:vitamin B12 transporter
LRRYIFHIALFFSISSFGQISSLDDTIRINEVVVNGVPYRSGSANKLNVVDSLILNDYSHDNISDAISENTSIFIKNYGSGGISTVSLRGTGAGYTRLAWNGVNLNSPMLGQTDLSLIPTGFIDEINILYGGASLSLSSGGIGGIINIETKPEWKDRTNILANFGAGSFGRYSSLIKVNAGKNDFQSSSKVLLQSSENNFLYLNNLTTKDPVFEKRRNASVNQNSFMQELYFKGKNKVISTKIWYQRTNRNIPVPIINSQPENGENQKDESLRTMITYSGYQRKTNHNSSISWFRDNMTYQNPLLVLNSKNLSNTIALRSNIEKNVDGNTMIIIILNDDVSIVNSVNYDGKRTRNMAGMTFSARRIFGQRIGLSTLIRQTLMDNNFLVPDFSTGMDYRVIKNKDSYIRLSISHNSKVPTLNDMYWNPGGKPSLKNENSITGELIHEMNFKISTPLTLNYQLSLYTISINDMIKWTPGELGYWSPSNIGKANSSGAEGNINLTYIISPFNLRFNAKYALNRSHLINSVQGEASNSDQLVYTPEHLFNAGIRSSYKRYYLSWMSCFTSKRYTTADNSDYLPGYCLNNLSAGIKFGKGTNYFDINIKTDNLFDVNYQTIEWYPMPGRSFMFSIIYQFIK